MVNKTVFGWDSLSHHCRNLSSNSCKQFNGGIQKWLPCLLKRLTWMAAETMGLSSRNDLFLVCFWCFMPFFCLKFSNINLGCAKEFTFRKSDDHLLERQFQMEYINATVRQQPPPTATTVSDGIYKVRQQHSFQVVVMARISSLLVVKCDWFNTIWILYNLVVCPSD